MKRPAQNFLVDSLSLVAFVLLVATGVIMYFVLPPGSHGTTLWGLGRHDWGDVHFWVAVSFLGLLAVHLILHWKWIVHMVRGRSQDDARARQRVTLGIVGVVALLMLIAAPLLSSTVERPGSADREGRGSGRAAVEQPATLDALTLDEVALVLGVSAHDLTHELGLPDRAADETLHQLADQHGLTLAEIRRAARVMTTVDASPLMN
ncbi:MAG: DUF4405 domain-containing protein [Bacteroidetes bacterium]|jgi:hypothetical protein|nr:DUF4405 domain-containing protein [Bacteroidota bacterium]